MLTSTHSSPYFLLSKLAPLINQVMFDNPWAELTTRLLDAGSSRMNETGQATWTAADNIPPYINGYCRLASSTQNKSTTRNKTPALECF